MALLAVTVALALAPAAQGHGQQAPARVTAMAQGTCGGAAITPDQVITGEFSTAQQGSYVMVPFDVPTGTTSVRVKYCYDQPEAPTSSQIRHTLDLGLYEPRADTSRTWGVPEFRGWGGSSHPDVTVSPEGFSSEAQYTASPRVEVPGKTTRAFRPGPIPAGEWAAELGVAAVASQSQGDSEGEVAWRLELDFSQDPAHADEPYQPAPYDSTPAKSTPGWYSGDLHVHAEHSAYGDATMTEAFDYAFKERSQGGAGLDFITLSDYVSGSSWGEIGRYQPSHPGKLIVRSAEVITYKGHLNNHNSATVVDYRTGPILERRGGVLVPVRAARPPSAIFGEIRSAGGYGQINHPTIFPSSVPGFASLCRGCPWDYTDAQTNYALVDGIEVATGPTVSDSPTNPVSNPFTVTAIQFWERVLAAGHKIAAIGVSDSHNAGRTPNPVTQAPIGKATTVVYAPELSEAGVRQGVEAGHTYVKVEGNGGPDLRLEASAPGASGPAAIMGDTLRADSAGFRARVLGGAPPAVGLPYTLSVVKDGATIRTVPVTSGDFTLSFPSTGGGRYRLQLQRGSAVSAVSSPIYLTGPSAAGGSPGSGAGAGGATTAGSAGRLRAGFGSHGPSRARRGRFLVRCRVRGSGRRVCRVRAVDRACGRKRTIAFGRAATRRRSVLVRLRLNRCGRHVLAKRRRGVRIRLELRATDPQGRQARATKRAVLRPAGR